MRDTFAQYIFEKAKANPSIRLITADLGFGVFDKFASELPDQFINSGVTEQSSVSMAAGLSEFSSKVFIYSIANFITFRPLEQIRNDICYHNKNVCLVSVGAGYSYGTLGYSHHLIEDISVISPLPNIKIYSPSNPFEVQLSLTKIFAHKGPTYLRLGRSLNQGDLSDNSFHSDDGFRYFSDGSQGSIVFTGGIKEIAFEVKKLLSESGLDYSLVSAPFISEISELNLREISSKGPVLVIEEHQLIGGLGSFIQSKANQLNVQINMHIFGLTNPQLDHIGSIDSMRLVNQLDPNSIWKWFIDRLKG